MSTSTRITLITLFFLLVCACSKQAEPDQAKPQAHAAKAAVSVASNPTVLGPLGFSRGQTTASLEQIGKLKEIDSGLYELSKVPAPNSRFVRYLAVASAATGLCKIVAQSAPIATNVFGTELKSEFADLQETLTNKYGKARTEVDFVRAGSLWNEPRDFMMGLRKGDRMLATVWSGKIDKKHPDTKPLAYNLESVSIKARALSSETTEIDLVYEFDNVDECLASLKKEDNKSL